jgi:hypothetical protein
VRGLDEADARLEAWSATMTLVRDVTADERTDGRPPRFENVARTQPEPPEPTIHNRATATKPLEAKVAQPRVASDLM